MIFVYRTSAVGPSEIPLSDYAEGDIIKLNESGSPVEFYVSKHDYESGLNGAGRTLVVRKDVYDQRQWHSSNVNAWASCTMLSWLNSTYKGLLDADIQEAMGTTTYRYTPGNGSWSVSTRSDAVFLLSLTELGLSDTYANVEGSALPIASILQISHLNGLDTPQWTRSPGTENIYGAFFLNKLGTVLVNGVSIREGSRPCFTLPSTLLFNPDTNEVVA